MAAYAGLVSLMNTMDNIQNHHRFSTSLDKKQIESLSEKLDFLLDFVESYNSYGGGISEGEVEDLESQIASAAYSAEDVIESHIVDEILDGSTEKSPSFLLDLEKPIEDLDSIKKKVMMVKENRGFKDQQTAYSTPAAPSRPLTTEKTTMVGSGDELHQLMDVLTSQQPSWQIISIVGMGGIGKTTLARNVYENTIIVQHFDVRAWVTVSQEYNVRGILFEILFEILSCLREPTGKMDQRTEDELGEQLHKFLYGRRYLIILDDIWSVEAWDNIKFFFPNNGNGSRIIVTTRLSAVADHFGSFGLTMSFLDEDKSWDLFCQKAFAQEDCPFELEEIGKKIVRKCKGLPLSISVIGGLLGKSPRRQEYWEHVAKDISSVDDNECLNILWLGYSHLPAYLKPCFLYMGILAEHHEIRVSRLIKLWVGEGFLKKNIDQSLEDIGEGYLKDLIDRNLILVCSLGSSGKFKTCKMHDLLIDLCFRMVEKEKFLCVTRVLGTPRDINRERRLIIRGSTTEKYNEAHVLHTLESTSLARSLICESPTLLFSKPRLLRVLIEVYSHSLNPTFQQVNLRFIAYESIRAPIGWIRTYELPSSISLLWNLQTLIFTGIIEKVVAPLEIWQMSQLRHLEFYRICLPDPPATDEKYDFVLWNLHTLGTVLDFRCTEEVCKRMPNIRKLRICYNDFSKKGETTLWDCLHNVGLFNKLESLYCCFYIVPYRDDLLWNLMRPSLPKRDDLLMFPSSLKKLILRDCELHWEDLRFIGPLPNLEVLKLKNQSVRGPEWNPVEGEFLCLKFLEIDSCYLICWNADSFHFPVLEDLVLGGLYKLDEIPSGIGEIPTLESISVVECSISAAISAVRIVEEQESVGNLGLQVRIKFRDWDRLEEFTETVELEGLTTHNCQIGCM